MYNYAMSNKEVKSKEKKVKAPYDPGQKKTMMILGIIAGVLAVFGITMMALIETGVL